MRDDSKMSMSKKESGMLGYLKSKHIFEEQKQKRIEQYELSPNFCKGCNKPLEYEKRHNKFCNQSCAASYNNTHKVKKEYGTCAVCKNKLIKRSQKKYCSKRCESKARRIEKYQKCITKDGEIIATSEQTVRRIAKHYLEDHQGHQCAICGIKEWLGKPILLICDHIDGDLNNTHLNNFRLICSNCDATLDTYKSKNKNKENIKRSYRKKYYKKDRAPIS